MNLYSRLHGLKQVRFRISGETPSYLGECHIYKGGGWNTGWVPLALTPVRRRPLTNIHPSPQEDAKKVYRDCGVSMRGCIDLSLLARSVDSRWKGKYSNPIGLANLVATYEFLALGKGKITRSNWEAQLSFNQQECECHLVVLLRGNECVARIYD